MLKRELISWLNSFYEEHPVTYRIFFFLLGWFITSSVIMQVQKHKLEKR